MAEEAFKKLEEILKCSICLCTFTEPKQLRCGHTLCQQCLESQVAHDRQQGRHSRSIKCPVCREVTPIPEGGVAGLQAAFLINPLLESYKNSLEETVGSAYCLEHPGRSVDVYCEDCDELVCIRCIIKGGKHHDHDHAVIDDAYVKHKRLILSAIEPMEEEVAAIKQALSQLDRCNDDICDQQKSNKEIIHNVFRQLREIANVREIGLVAKLNQITEVKKKNLAAQRDQIETTLTERISCVYLLKENLQADSKVQLLKTVANVKRIRELVPFQLHSWKPNVLADTCVVFKPVLTDTLLTTACQNYGEIVTTDLPDPSRCQASGGGLKVAVVGEKSTVRLSSTDFALGAAMKPFKSLECRLTSELLGFCSVEQSGIRSYDISYQPTVKGRHQLLIKADGQHIPGSPFSVAVMSSMEKLGTPMFTFWGVKEPRGITINRSGEVVVTEGGARCVSVFTPGGVKLRSFGEDQLMDPGGIAVDNEGNILVVDMVQRCIVQFTAEGQFVTSVAGSAFLQPTDIAFNSCNGYFYVLDKGSKCVHWFSSDLTDFHTSLAHEQFSDEVWGITLDRDGDGYITDTGKNRVHVFSTGVFQFGSRHQGLSFPSGVCIDGNYRVYVREYCRRGINRVSVFTKQGQFIKSFQWTSQADNFTPKYSGLVTNSGGVVYVCDNADDCIRVY